MTNRLRPAYRVSIGHKTESGEWYAFVFDADRGCELYRVFGRYASDPERSFTWTDAARLSRRVRLVMEALGQ